MQLLIYTPSRIKENGAASGGNGDVEGKNVESAGGDPRRITPPKKRFREGAGSSSKSKQKKADDQPQQGVLYKCSLCPALLDRSKSLFGHIKTHKDPNWRGAYPLPVSTRQQIDSDMAKEEEDAADQRRDEGVPTVVETTPDLNVSAPEDGVAIVSTHSPEIMDGKEFDLNRSPSPDS
ncbi:uncharacterized protein LOC132282124 [Cornus florida]|uniref:uncharacterized protein LOC132282124 n=1 Tax=Cornus florida TaxID=4283 RepID=UPI00289DE7F6|nr:uncharacterized protein LOC132282124 [Cornus florida]